MHVIYATRIVPESVSYLYNLYMQILTEQVTIAGHTIEILHQPKITDLIKYLNEHNYITGNTLNIHTHRGMFVLCLEFDYFLVNKFNQISDIYSFGQLIAELEAQGLKVLSSSQLSILTSTKKYYHLFPELVLPTIYTNVLPIEYYLLSDTNKSGLSKYDLSRFTETGLQLEMIDFTKSKSYIVKFPHSSSGAKILTINQENAVENLIKIRELSIKYKIPVVIIQPMLLEYCEFKFIYINGKLKAKLASEAMGNVAGQFIIDLNKYIECTARYQSLIEGEEGRLIIRKLNTYYLPKLAEAETFSQIVLDKLNEYLSHMKSKNPFYIRIDVFYDILSDKFYLNEFEPFASGKLFSDFNFCNSTKAYVTNFIINRFVSDILLYISVI